MIVDIICHGVPSQKMLNRQLNTIKRRNHITSIESMSFRQNSEFNLLIKGIHMGVGTMTIKESCLKIPIIRLSFMGSITESHAISVRMHAKIESATFLSETFGDLVILSRCHLSTKRSEPHFCQQ